MTGDRKQPASPDGLASLVGLWDDCDDFVDDVQKATRHRRPPRDLPELATEEPPEEGDPAEKTR